MLTQTLCAVRCRVIIIIIIIIRAFVRHTMSASELNLRRRRSEGYGVCKVRRQIPMQHSQNYLENSKWSQSATEYLKFCATDITIISNGIFCRQNTICNHSFSVLSSVLHPVSKIQSTWKKNIFIIKHGTRHLQCCFPVPEGTLTKWISTQRHQMQNLTLGVPKITITAQCEFTLQSQSSELVSPNWAANYYRSASVSSLPSFPICVLYYNNQLI